MLRFQETHLTNGHSAYYPSMEMSISIKKTINDLFKNINDYVNHNREDCKDKKTFQNYSFIPNILITSIWNNIYKDTQIYSYAFPYTLDLKLSSEVFINKYLKMKEEIMPYIVSSFAEFSKDTFLKDLNTLIEKIINDVSTIDLFIKIDDRAWWEK